ncbi:hypothetical protein K9N68_30670 [Kovacikia minuta CCNUW1]|uniref:hypothetical protein n=1 Tax=Kovacikia minuta TaxID=2931930 RepID=UPI001CCAC434|nr:hypothetical protein [Kovacikia minuta]UBF25859.1 hypothetical protein K9N68_30670 [Kovacikia minuta CCNUW1]
MKVQLFPAVAVFLLVGCSNFPGQDRIQSNSQHTIQSDGVEGPQTNFQENAQRRELARAQSGSPPRMETNEPLSAVPQSAPTPQAPEVALAVYLNQSGAMLYDAENCPYCQKQQRLFGATAFQQLKVVNCGPWDRPYLECRQLGIRTFPTWEIGGKRYPTILPLEEIAEISGFNRSGAVSGLGSQGGSQ